MNLSTCIWFDGKAKDAYLFYKEVFGDVALISENPFTVNYHLFGRRFMHLNGGPGFPINPSISFFISASSAKPTEARRCASTICLYSSSVIYILLLR